MGYTHYYKIKKDTPDIVVKLASGVIKQMLWDQTISHYEGGGCMLANAFGEGQTFPNIMSDVIMFNGIEGDGHETFTFPRTMKYYEGREVSSDGETYFEFTKTAQKPYDKYVTAAMVIAAAYMGDKISISSDGGLEDWEAGMEIALKYTKFETFHELVSFVESRLNMDK